MKKNFLIVSGADLRSSDNTLVKKNLNCSPEISTKEGMKRLFNHINLEHLKYIK